MKDVCAGCGVDIHWDDETDTWQDAQGGQTCGPANPMCRGDGLDPYHEP